MNHNILIKLKEDKWIDKTKETLAAARKISDDKPVVGILSDKDFTFVDNDTDDPDVIVSRCQDLMKRALGGNPDFSYMPQPRMSAVLSN